MTSAPREDLEIAWQLVAERCRVLDQNRGLTIGRGQPAVSSHRGVPGEGFDPAPRGQIRTVEKWAIRFLSHREATPPAPRGNRQADSICCSLLFDGGSVDDVRNKELQDLLERLGRAIHAAVVDSDEVNTVSPNFTAMDGTR